MRSCMFCEVRGPLLSPGYGMAEASQPGSQRGSEESSRLRHDAALKALAETSASALVMETILIGKAVAMLPQISFPLPISKCAM